MKKIFYFTLLISITVTAQPKILFDASKAQMAGNADWVIDTDLNNITYTGGPASIGGSESNPQRFPTPAQSGITATTPETFWTGAISSWAVDCAKLGYIVETLPYNGLITYGSATNLQDLSNYKVFVIDEPNIAFTTSEKDAIINFVKNGGGLFMVSDHDVSDRNNDGVDSPTIFNDLLGNNNIQQDPFGIAFNLVSFSQTTTNVAVIASNPILNGTFGNVTSLKYSAGTSMTLNTVSNPSVKGLIFKTGSSNTGTTNVMFAMSTYQSGKVVALGDSSPPDDGTGDINDQLYLGYSDLSGNHRNLIMNATKWLATPNPLGLNDNIYNKISFKINPNPINNNELRFSYNLIENNSISISIYDSVGREINSTFFNDNNVGENNKTINLAKVSSGIYFCKINVNQQSETMRFVVN
jgi:Secretion system C-terminal sorting domain